MVGVTWTAPTPSPIGGPTTGDERPMLEAYLQWQRTTLLNICAGLSAEQLARRPVPPSPLSLLGLVRHLAKVERVWFRQRVAQENVPALHDGPGSPTDFQQGQIADAPRDVETLTQEWQRADDAVAELPLDHTITVRDETWSLRMVYLHVIGEYARHNGHADLIREQIDGVTSP
jgi:uncharacterized damage-inducible protein DinB